MELYLIRHGETVDNVAGLYAGVRDSALTNHGVEQARRLGEHFREQGVRFSHVFSSTLSRARQTAEAIVTAQQKLDVPPTDAVAPALAVVQVADLIEQNFGFYEGKSFQARTDAKKSGKDSHREKHRDDPGFVDVESKASMMQRADAFIDAHLVPLFAAAAAAAVETLEPSERSAIAVVSHGILLGNLWRRLLARLPPRSVIVDGGVAATRGTVVLEHLGGWSNTGYLHLSLTRAQPSRVTTTPTKKQDDPPTAAQPAPHPPSSAPASPVRASPTVLVGWSARIRAIDSKEHLVGLKRQRGGIGSLAHDKGQKKLDGFFKRQRTD